MGLLECAVAGAACGTICRREPQKPKGLSPKRPRKSLSSNALVERLTHQVTATCRSKNC
jgi:hypothetical protein